MTCPPEPVAVLSTLADLPFHVMGRHPKPMLVGRCVNGEIGGVSSKEWFERIRDLSLGLAALGMRAGDRIAIMSDSRPEWLLTDLAILTAGAVTVPIYPTLSAVQARYILDDSGARIAVVSNAAQLEKIQQVRHELPHLESVIAFDEIPQPTTSLVPFGAVADRGHARMVAEWGVGRQFRETARAVKPGDLATIIYTSGTTGEPKGVMLTHGNLVSNLESGQAVLAVNSDDVALSFLPLSHSFERLVSYIYLANGVTIVFAESMETIGRDIPVVRPTLMTGVPRLYEKLQARMIETGSSMPPPRNTMFRWGVRTALARAKAEFDRRPAGPILSLRVALADRLVFSKIRERLGGRVRYLVSGSAPLPVSVAAFFQGIGLPIVEGYGLTETAPILTVNPPLAPKPGSVGKAIPGVEIRIAEDGEILARGANVMRGYYHKPEATSDALRGGWFHTGDIGTIDADGYLTITDRKKDLLVTSGGKKVAPQPLEALLTRSPLVQEAVVLGDRRKFIAALIVPDFAHLERRLRDLGRPPADRAALVVREDVVALYQEIVDALNRDLSQFERIKRIRLLPRELSIEAGELTPTMKVKRRAVEAAWQQEIAEIYSDS